MSMCHREEIECPECGYKSELEADAMVKFDMIDTATSGIKKVFRIQKEKFFPMPEYGFSEMNQVGVTVHGKILDEKYTHILHDHPELDIETVFLLDQVRKGNGSKLSNEAVTLLRKHKLVEGRKSSLFLSSSVSASIEEEASYIKNKAFDNKYYKDMIVRYIEEFGKAQKRDIKKLLWDKLPDSLSDSQKEIKIKNLLMLLRNEGIIKTDSDNKQKSNWILG